MQILKLHLIGQIMKKSFFFKVDLPGNVVTFEPLLMDLELQGIEANPLNLNLAKSFKYHSSGSYFMFYGTFTL